MATQGHHVPETTTLTRTWDLTPAEVARDGLSRLRAAGQGHRLALIIAAILAAIGVVAIVVGPLIAGYDNRQNWTYVAIAFGYLMAAVGSAPCLSVAMRLVRGHWRRPVNRISELWAAALIVPMILFFLLLGTLPGTEGRPTLWFGWPASPWLWDSILMITLVLCGYAFLYVASIPDFAVAREKFEAENPGLFTRLAAGFFGTEAQWRTLERAVSLLGVFYVILYVGTATVFTGDFIMSLIPGYKSAIFPLWIVETSFQAGVALTLVTAAILRKWGGRAVYLEVEQFFALAKLLLALGLLWFYLTWTDFIILWYGRMPNEIALLKLLYFDRYLWLFLLAFGLNFALPLLVLMWTRIRRSISGPIVAACGVLIGCLADRIRYYSAAFSTPDITVHGFVGGVEIPATYYPDVLDILILVGSVGAAASLLLLAVRYVPYPSIWEMTAGLRLRARKRFNETEVILIGKPE